MSGLNSVMYIQMSCLSMSTDGSIGLCIYIKCIKRAELSLAM